MSEQQPQTDLVRAGDRLDRNQSIAGFFANKENAHNVATNIDLVGRAGLALVLKCTSEPSIPSEELERVPFRVKYYYAHSVELSDQRTGEVFDRVRVVLISDEGETTSFASMGVIDSLDILRRYLGDGPYDPPIKVKAVRVKTRKGNVITKLELIDDEPAEATATNRGRSKS